MKPEISSLLYSRSVVSKIAELQTINVKDFTNQLQAQFLAIYSEEGNTKRSRKLYLHLVDTEGLPLAKYIEYPKKYEDKFQELTGDNYLPKESIVSIRDILDSSMFTAKEKYELVEHFMSKGIRGFINN